jgi:hypothetical protein
VALLVVGTAGLAVSCKVVMEAVVIMAVAEEVLDGMVEVEVIKLTMEVEAEVDQVTVHLWSKAVVAW